MKYDQNWTYERPEDLVADWLVVLLIFIKKPKPSSIIMMFSFEFVVLNREDDMLWIKDSMQGISYLKKGETYIYEIIRGLFQILAEIELKTVTTEAHTNHLEDKTPKWHEYAQDVTYENSIGIFHNTLHIYLQYKGYKIEADMHETLDHIECLRFFKEWVYDLLEDQMVWDLVSELAVDFFH